MAISLHEKKLADRRPLTCLDLAEIQLEKRLEANRRMPGLFTEKELSRYRKNVSVAKRHLASVHRDGDVVEVHLQHAREQADISRTDYEEALKVVKTDPEIYSDYEMAELRLKAEIADLRLEIWTHPETNVLSLMDHMHWQLERVSEEVLELQRRVDKLELN